MNNQVPACFGISICHNPLTETCRRCPARQPCAELARKEAIEIAKSVKIPKLLERLGVVQDDDPDSHNPKTITSFAQSVLGFAELAPLIDALPNKKSAHLARQLVKRNIDPRELIENDTATPYLYLDFVCQTLKERRFVSKQRMILLVQAKFAWTEPSAKDLVNTVFGMLRGLGVIDLKKGIYVVKDAA